MTSELTLGRVLFLHKIFPGRIKLSYHSSHHHFPAPFSVCVTCVPKVKTKLWSKINMTPAGFSSHTFFCPKTTYFYVCPLFSSFLSSLSMHACIKKMLESRIPPFYHVACTCNFYYFSSAKKR